MLPGATRSFPGPGHKQVSFVSPGPGPEKRPQVTEKCFAGASHLSELMGKLSPRGSFQDTGGDVGPWESHCTLQTAVSASRAMKTLNLKISRSLPFLKSLVLIAEYS